MAASVIVFQTTGRKRRDVGVEVISELRQAASLSIPTANTEKKRRMETTTSRDGSLDPTDEVKTNQGWTNIAEDLKRHEVNRQHAADHVVMMWHTHVIQLSDRMNPHLGGITDIAEIVAMYMKPCQHKDCKDLNAAALCPTCLRHDQCSDDSVWPESTAPPLDVSTATTENRKKIKRLKQKQQRGSRRFWDTLCGNCEKHLKKCCECRFCGECGEFVTKMCPQCDECAQCCKCIHCQKCSQLVEKSDMCAVCDAECEKAECNACCKVHVTCESCDEQVNNGVCDDCEECHNCCKCTTCAECHQEVATRRICSRCHHCDTCCDCISCKDCGELRGSLALPLWEDAPEDALADEIEGEQENLKEFECSGGCGRCVDCCVDKGTCRACTVCHFRRTLNVDDICDVCDTRRLTSQE